MKYPVFIFIFLFCECRSNSSNHDDIKGGLEGQANKAYDLKDYEKAARLFDSLIIKNPTKGEFYFKSAY